MNRTGPLVVFMLGCLAVLTADARELTAGDSRALTHVWELNLNEYPRQIDGRLVSPDFTTWNRNVEETWRLWFKPHGSTGIPTECLAVYLYHVKEHPVTTDFTIILFNQGFGKEYAKHQSGTLYNTNGYGSGPCFPGYSANSPPNGIYNPKYGFVANGKLKIGVRIPSDPIPIKPMIDQCELCV
uniref:Cytoplasmic dynein 2 heavy chain 1 n=1 Tax=Lygus hesperus TaxID=30085 RepID=A0A0A9WQQ0_LYGHE